MGRGRRGGKLTPPLPLMKEVLMAKEKQMNLENPQTIHACGRNAALNQTVNLWYISKHVLNAVKTIQDLGSSFKSSKQS